MEAKFTKGPWSYDGISVIDENSIDICDVNPDNKANAKLIAAAPEMYELLKRAYRILKDEGAQNTASEIEELLNNINS